MGAGGTHRTSLPCFLTANVVTLYTETGLQVDDAVS